MPSPNPLRCPTTAWPTVALAVAATGSFVAAMALTAAGVIPIWGGGIVTFVAAFAAFTPMHDASHRSVSRHRWLNEVVGRVSSVVLGSPFAAFRYVHLEHHKHTNHAEKDPDHYSGRGPKWQLPLRWLSQDLHYYVVVATQWPKLPKNERIELALNVMLLLCAFGLLAWSGHGLVLLAVWLLPTRLAIAALSFSFDYLPHVPHETTAAEDRYRATRILLAPGLTALFLYQNYHLIHHLYPGVPFYRYAAIFDAQQQKLAARGMSVWQLGSPATTQPTTA